MNSVGTHTVTVLRDVEMERVRQDEKWGQQDHSPSGWLVVLMEEVGEAAQQVAMGFVDPLPEPREALRRTHVRHLRRELIQVAAVAVAAVESLDRNELDGDA